MTGARGASGLGSRRLLVASVLLGAFVLFDLGLLGWLIFRSLSQREIERVLLETREEAEALAQEIAGDAESGEDLYTLIAIEREKQTYIDSILKNRDIVQDIEIRDAEGRLVFRGRAETFAPARDPALTPIESSEVAPRVEESTVTRRDTIDWDMDVPIGELGVLHVGISQVEMGRRIAVLRGELLRQTLLISAVTLALLVIAYLTIAGLWRRGRRLEEQAAEAERLAYIGTLASGLAHEIRNPLNSLNLNIQLLEEEAGRPAGAGSSRRLLSITREEIGRLERLVTDFLLYAKPRPLELESVAAGALLDRCRDLLAGEFGSRGARLEVEDRTVGVRVRVDREQMTQLLVNLAQNGLAAVEGAPPPRRVVLRALREGGRVVLEVEDNGIGIPHESRERIFELFYSTRKGGTGLGLAVVRRIAQAHGSVVEVLSRPGSGTRVRVALSEHRPAAEPTPSEVVEAGARA